MGPGLKFYYKPGASGVVTTRGAKFYSIAAKAYGMKNELYPDSIKRPTPKVFRAMYSKDAGLTKDQRKDRRAMTRQMTQGGMDDSEAANNTATKPGGGRYAFKAA